MRWETAVFAVGLALLMAPNVDGSPSKGRSASSYTKVRTRTGDDKESAAGARAAGGADAEDDEPSWAKALREGSAREEKVRKQLEEKERQRQEKEAREQAEKEERERPEIEERERQEKEKRERLEEEERKRKVEEERERKEKEERERKEEEERERKEKEERERKEKEERERKEKKERDRQEEERKWKEHRAMQSTIFQRESSVEFTTSTPAIPSVSPASIASTVLDQVTQTASPRPPLAAKEIDISNPESQDISSSTIRNSATKNTSATSLQSEQREQLATLKQECDEFEDASGYMRMPGTRSRYKFFTKPEDWPSAKRRCERDGAYLAVANTEVEARALTYLMHMAHFPGNPSHMHVGVSDIDQEGVWRALDGIEFNGTYVRWSRNQPEVNNRKQNCMELYDDLTNVDFKCEGKISFACEKSISK